MGMQTSRFSLIGSGYMPLARWIRTMGAQSTGENLSLFRQGFAIYGTRLGGLFHFICHYC